MTCYNTGPYNCARGVSVQRPCGCYFPYKVDPHLSEPRLSSTLIIRHGQINDIHRILLNKISHSWPLEINYFSCPHGTSQEVLTCPTVAGTAGTSGTWDFSWY